MWRYHLSATPLRVGLFGAALLGAVAGGGAALAAHSFLVGLFVVAIGGPAFGLLMSLSSRRTLAPLSGLAIADRATVMRTVQKGLPVTERRLAPAVAGYAEAVRLALPRWIGGNGDTRRLFYVSAGVQVCLALLRALDGEWAWMALYLVGAAFGLTAPKLNAAAAERRDHAERSARELLASA